jgi:glycosyltransferase involved in cell wall biosynthesis
MISTKESLSCGDIPAPCYAERPPTRAITTTGTLRHVEGHPITQHDRDVRVAYDCHSLLTSPTGVARYTRRLGEALEGIGVELRRFAVGWHGAPPAGVRHWRLPNPIVHRAWRLAGVPRIGRLTGDVDLLHGTEFVLPPLGRTPAVVTVHDLSYLRDDAFPGARRLQTMVPWSLERARRVIVPSRAVGAEVEGRYDVGGRVDVVYEGVGDEFFDAVPLDEGELRALGIERPFVLVVGEVQPRKNLPRLLTAWSEARRALPGWTLALAGPAGWGPSVPATDGAVPLGWVADDVLPRLMASADLFAYPSLYEGFGLPPLEAMAAGTAVLAGRYGPAEELLGDAARLVDQTSTAELAGALVDLAQDEGARAAFAARGRTRVEQFRWETAARATVASYEAALAS